jgi:hypothetical protein
VPAQPIRSLLAHTEELGDVDHAKELPAGYGSKLSLEKREKGTHRGGSPSHSQPRPWIARAGRFNDRKVDQTVAGTPS